MSDFGKEESSLNQFSLSQLLAEIERRLVGMPLVTNDTVEALTNLRGLASQRMSKEGEVPPVQWAKRIREVGVGRLHGKFSEELYKRRQKPDLKSPQGFEDIDSFPSSDKAGILHGKDPLWNFFVGVPQDPSNNYLFVYRPFDERDDFGKLLGTKGQSVTILYIMRSDYRYTPGARGHHIPLGLHLCLPLPEAKEFIAKVEDNPDFMEEVFQAMYPGFTDLLPRPKAKGIKLLDLGQLDESKLGLFREYLSAEDIDEKGNLKLTSNVCNLLIGRNPFKDLSFSKPVGETELEVE